MKLAFNMSLIFLDFGVSALSDNIMYHMKINEGHRCLACIVCIKRFRLSFSGGVAVLF